MSIREIDLAQFNEFARQQIEAGRGDVSLSTLAEQWERRQQSIQVHEKPEHRNPRLPERGHMWKSSHSSRVSSQFNLRRTSGLIF